MIIRLAQSHELSQLADVEKSAAHKFHIHYGITPYTKERTVAHEVLEKAHHEHNLWVAAIDENVIGFLAANTLDDGVHIHEISVRHDQQNRGIGKKLLNAFFAEACARKYVDISLTTNREIPWNYPFYQRLGFHTVELGECKPGLAEILKTVKNRSDNPDVRIAMVMTL